MLFSKHLFISYTHIDNQKLEGQQDGWISRLHKTLAVQLEMRLGEKAVIWWDEKLAGNDNFSEEIIAQFADVGLLISVLSPRYIKSDWCKREAREFCKAADAAGGLEINRKSRVFKVYKLPVDTLEGLPEEFGRGLGFPFYKSKDGVVVELDPAYGHEMVGDFNLSVAMLAQKLAETVEMLRAAGGLAKEASPKGPTIYLGETSWDCEPQRKMLEAELSNRGYSVVPDRSLPSRENECEAEIAKLLADCKMALHIIGNQAGMVPSGPSQRSVDLIQNELASQQSKSRGLPRIVWLPAGTQSKNPEHQKFLDALARNEDVQFGADVVTGDFECLKSTVLDALRRLQAQEAATSHPAADGEAQLNGKLLYVVCDRRDTKVTVALRKSLRQRGFDPQRPLFDGDASAVRRQNDRLLNQCQATLIYYGAGDEEWYRSTLTELEKVRQRVPVWTYVGEPITSHKQELLDEFEGGPIINGVAADVPERELDRMLTGLPVTNATRGAAG